MAKEAEPAEVWRASSGVLGRRNPGVAVNMGCLPPKRLGAPSQTPEALHQTREAPPKTIEAFPKTCEAPLKIQEAFAQNR
jgi:hypothetical protein